ncbi:MAG: ATP-dependent RecD-like DNA helicase [Victivallaceae bacterium]|nr:ATP-dependent RecD-like DNA helicase [Victivallaceae bacterium]
MAQPESVTTVEGEILGVRYESPENGFKVLTVRVRDGEKITVCGNFDALYPGQWGKFTGHFESHRDFGREFKASGGVVTLPGTLDGVRHYLASCVPGIGRTFAGKIVDFFQGDTLDVLDRHPERLLEVPGIGKKKGESIGRVWRENSLRRDGMIFLQGLGVSLAGCDRLFRRYGADAPEIVRNDPYKLAEEIDGIGFTRADMLGRKLGIEPESEKRLLSAALYVMGLYTSGGHVGAPYNELIDRVAEVGSVPREAAEKGVESALASGKLRRDLDLVYPRNLYRAEAALPELIARLAGATEFAGRKMKKTSGGKLALAPEQLQAVETVSKSPLCIITGGPGVGKTTVVGEIVGRARKANLRIRLAAPTGRAAKRLAEATKQEAMTLHRLLQYDPVSGGFHFGAETPLECDLLIVDEVSMLDLPLGVALFSALRPGMSLVLVGDADQLPSVGPGRLLRDFIGSPLFAVTKLTRIFRQGAGSEIIVNSHQVNAGTVPDLTKKSGLHDFYWIEQDDPVSARALIGRLVAERIPARFGFDPMREIQVLTPMNRGECGTVALNEYLGKMLNGGEMTPGFQRNERDFRRGDKVMQISNNYDKNVFNGDIGILSEIHNSKKRFFVTFEDERTVEYSFDEAAQLVRAYAVTVHKSQGCEFPCVVMALLNAHYMMLQRQLLYTAMTRARKLLILVGSRRALNMAVHNIRVEPRHTRLPERLKAMENTLFFRKNR